MVRFYGSHHQTCKKGLQVSARRVVYSSPVFSGLPSRNLCYAEQNQARKGCSGSVRRRLKSTQRGSGTTLGGLDRYQRKSSLQKEVIIIGDGNLPENHRETLKLGPKFAFEPTYSPPERVEAARTIARQVKEDERSECIDVYSKTRGTCRLRPNPPRALPDFLVANELHVVVGDKEGCFVVLTESDYSEKALPALEKKFKKVEGKPSQVKERAITLIIDDYLEKVASSVRKVKKNVIEPVRRSQNSQGRGTFPRHSILEQDITFAHVGISTGALEYANPERPILCIKDGIGCEIPRRT